MKKAINKKIRDWNISIRKSKRFQKYELWVMWYKDLNMLKINISCIHICIWKDKPSGSLMDKTTGFYPVVLGSIPSWKTK